MAVTWGMISVPLAVGEVLVFVASSDMHCAAFGDLDEHVVVAGSVTYYIHRLLQSRDATVMSSTNSQRLG